MSRVTRSEMLNAVTLKRRGESGATLPDGQSCNVNTEKRVKETSKTILLQMRSEIARLWCRCTPTS